MSLLNPLLSEVDREGATTRRLLERVPTDRLAWQPHARSMTLGGLAMHLANAPGRIAEWGLVDSFEFPAVRASVEAASTAQIVAAHDEGIARIKNALAKIGEDGLRTEWQATKNGVPFLKMPKIGLIRSIVLNHSIHHRGQLSIYLRMLDVPVPSIYGPSADENPFD